MNGKTHLRYKNINILVSDSKSKYSEIYVKLIIFIIQQFLTILESSCLGTHRALINGSPLIFLLKDIEKKMHAFLFLFCRVFPKNVHAEHFVRFYFTHPLVLFIVYFSVFRFHQPYHMIFIIVNIYTLYTPQREMEKQSKNFALSASFVQSCVGHLGFLVSS